MEILINFATRNRPDKARLCFENIRELQSKPLKIILKVDNDDNSDYFFASDIIRGENQTKIEAINRGNLLDYKWDILLNHSDDMWFTRIGFDKIIVNDMLKYFPDTDGVLHYPDGHAPSLLSYSIIGRKYFERDKYIYNPAYISLWCDNEAQDVARERGKYKFIENQIFEHRHPVWGAAQWDNQYREQASYYHIDQQTYLQRKNNGFSN